MIVKTPTIEALIREQVQAANGKVDKDAVARIVYEQLSADDKRALVMVGIKRRLHGVLERTRTSPSVTNRRDNRSRWADVEQALSDYWVSLQDGVAMRLVDCTAQDLISVAGFYHDRAQQQMVRAKAYKKLAEVLKDSDCSTVGELDPKQVKEIIDV